jgi:hypothetical protein
MGRFPLEVTRWQGFQTADRVLPSIPIMRRLCV